MTATRVVCDVVWTTSDATNMDARRRERLSTYHITPTRGGLRYDMLTIIHHISPSRSLPKHAWRPGSIHSFVNSPPQDWRSLVVTLFYILIMVSSSPRYAACRPGACHLSTLGAYVKQRISNWLITFTSDPYRTELSLYPFYPRPATLVLMSTS
jgi:hypothetical protein